jgi:Uma2 family endonuclease
MTLAAPSPTQPSRVDALSPDAALVRLERWEGLSLTERRSFPPPCPDLVVELARPSDEGPLFPGLQIELQEIWSG